MQGDFRAGIVWLRPYIRLLVEDIRPSEPCCISAHFPSFSIRRPCRRGGGSSVWIAGFLISPCCVTKLLPGKRHVITTKRRSTGAFIRRMPASHSNDSIHQPLVRDGCLRGSVCKPLKSKRLAPVKISVVDH